MITQFLNVIKLHAQMAANNITVTRIGIINNYDPTKYAATAILQPSDPENIIETGWLPVFTPWVGNEWGMFSPPSIGDMCEIQFQDGNMQAGLICLRGFNNTNLPLSVSSGEFWLVHKSGSFIKLMNDGKISINGDEAIDVNSTVVNLGNISGTLRKLLNETAKDVFNQHTHNIVGGGITDIPNQSMGDSNLTANVKAT